MSDELKGIRGTVVRMLFERQSKHTRQMSTKTESPMGEVARQQDTGKVLADQSHTTIRTEQSAHLLAAKVAEKIGKDPNRALQVHQVHEGMLTLL